MGVESKFYILPETSGFRPSPAAVCQLVGALQAASFLCHPRSSTYAAKAHQRHSLQSDPDYDGFWWKERAGRNVHARPLNTLEPLLAEHQASDLLLRWPNSDLNLSGLQYPLSLVPGPEGVYYDIEFHFAEHTIYHTSDIIDPFAEIRCPCGTEIQSFEPSDQSPLYDSRLPNLCPRCRQVMNYATLPVTLRDAWSASKSTTLGAVVYRFAIVVDCGKYWPESEAIVTPEFLTIIEQTLKIKTRVVRDFY